MKEYIQITRHPDGKPHYVNLVVLASNGITAGALEFYTSTEELEEIAKALSGRTEDMWKDYLFERGSERLEDKQANYFRLRVSKLKEDHGFTIQLRMNNNSKFSGYRYFLPELSEFYIHTTLERINLLGDLLAKFSKLKEQRLYWSPTEAFLDIESKFKKGEARDNIVDARLLLPE